MEEMRQGLGSDRVFDLIGDLLEDHEISLADLIIDCITNRRRLEDAVNPFVRGLDTFVSHRPGNDA